VNFVETQQSKRKTNQVRVYLNNRNLKFPSVLQGIIKQNNKIFQKASFEALELIK
jgi:hypothetical protein